VAEVGRAPFDLPEAEQELVAGYHVEYSGMRWGLFPDRRVRPHDTISALMVTLFFGGWLFPFGHRLGPLWFALKLAIVLFCSSGLAPRCRACATTS